jgi:peptide/nickel transport system permease protein
MLRFIIKRLLVALLTLAAVDVITFGLFFAVPSSPAAVMCSKDCNQEKLDRVNHALGLDKPKLTQFVEFNKGLVLGRDIVYGDKTDRCPAPCLGYSFRTSEAVTKIMARGLPVTVSIVLGAFVLWIFFGVGLGCIRPSIEDSSATRFPSASRSSAHRCRYTSSPSSFWACSSSDWG